MTINGRGIVRLLIPGLVTLAGLALLASPTEAQTTSSGGANAGGTMTGGGSSGGGANAGGATGGASGGATGGATGGASGGTSGGTSGGSNGGTSGGSNGGTSGGSSGGTTTVSPLKALLTAIEEFVDAEFAEEPEEVRELLTEWMFFSFLEEYYFGGFGHGRGRHRGW